MPKHHSQEFPVLGREHVTSFDIETMTELMEMCGENYHKVHKKWKSGLSMIKHLQQDIVKSEQIPQGSVQRDHDETNAQPVGVETETHEGHEEREESKTEKDHVNTTHADDRGEHTPETETKKVFKTNETLEETLQQEHDKGEDLQIEFLATEGKALLKDVQILADLSSAHVTSL